MSTEGYSYKDLLKAMPEIAEVVNAFQGESVQREAFLVLVGSLGVETVSTGPAGSPSTAEGRPSAGTGNRRAQSTTKPKASAKKKSGSKSGPSIVHDLNLRPSGDVTLDEFAAEKRPKTQQEQSTVIVYYLRHMLGRDAVTTDDVFTGYKHMKWRVPTNLENQLQQIKTKKGWLNTSNMSAIDVTTIGQNFVEHDLPKDSDA